MTAFLLKIYVIKCYCNTYRESICLSVNYHHRHPPGFLTSGVKQSHCPLLGPSTLGHRPCVIPSAIGCNAYLTEIHGAHGNYMLPSIWVHFATFACGDKITAFQKKVKITCTNVAHTRINIIADIILSIVLVVVVSENSRSDEHCCIEEKNILGWGRCAGEKPWHVCT